MFASGASNCGTGVHRRVTIGHLMGPTLCGRSRWVTRNPTQALKGSGKILVEPAVTFESPGGLIRRADDAAPR